MKLRLSVPWFIVLPLALLALWHFAVTLRWVTEGVIPSPEQVVRSWHTWIFGSSKMMLSPYAGTWLDNVTYSTRRVLQGFGLAALVAIPLGLMIGWSRLAARLIDPTVQLLRPVPITAWLPFAIAVFGIYDASALFLIGLGAFYPIVVNTTHGVRDTNLLLLRAARMLGAGPLTVLAKVVFPSALPSIFTGLRLGIGVAWTAVIVAEMIAVKSGLGYVLWDAYYVGRMDICVATMFSVGLARFPVRSGNRLGRAPGAALAHARGARMIELDGVWKEFAKGERRVLALEDISLKVAEREFVAILGPSGCGKSTLLNMVAGFDSPSRGTVRVDGEEITEPSPRRGVVFQEPALFPWFSVMENVLFGPKTQRQPAADSRQRASQILEQVGLRGFESSYPAELSGGMRQRVGIARVLIMQPQVLLMDEPFGSLDAQTRMLMQELLLQVWERHHQTVLFITHDIEEALLLADRVCVMTARPGRIKKSIDVGIPRPRAIEVTTSPEFNALRREVLGLIREESELAAMETAAR